MVKERMHKIQQIQIHKTQETNQSKQTQIKQQQKIMHELCTGTTQRDGMGREEGGGFRMGNTCIPVADSF